MALRESQLFNYLDFTKEKRKTQLSLTRFDALNQLSKTSENKKKEKLTGTKEDMEKQVG